MLQVCRNGQVKTINADTKPFTMEEAYYDDAKFYLKDVFVKDVFVKDALLIHGKKDSE